jgi:hypothetical protein
VKNLVLLFTSVLTLSAGFEVLAESMQATALKAGTFSYAKSEGPARAHELLEKIQKNNINFLKALEGQHKYVSQEIGEHNIQSHRDQILILCDRIEKDMKELNLTIGKDKMFLVDGIEQDCLDFRATKDNNSKIHEILFMLAWDSKKLSEFGAFGSYYANAIQDEIEKTATYDGQPPKKDKYVDVEGYQEVGLQPDGKTLLSRKLSVVKAAGKGRSVSVTGDGGGSRSERNDRSGEGEGAN